MSKNRYPRLLGLLPLLGTLLLAGCNMTLLDPKGQVGLDERNLIITATLLMLLVVVPVIVMTFLFAWKYRASNTDAVYTPKWSHSTKIEIAVWAVPVLIIIALGYVTYKSTHALDPYVRWNPTSSRSPLKWSRWTGSGCSSTRSKASPRSTRSCSRPTRQSTSRSLPTP